VPRANPWNSDRETTSFAFANGAHQVRARTREPHRGTNAFAKEACRMLVEHAPRPRNREALLKELVEQGVPGDETVDRTELVDILRDAAQARNGWKRILARCAEQRSRSRNTSALRA
jgi:hypothetical protein